MSILSIVLVGIIFLSIPYESAFAATSNVIIPEGHMYWPSCEKFMECFDPAVVIVTIGDEVVWHNQDSVTHTITSGTPSSGPTGNFDLIVKIGYSEKVRFDKPGIFPYFCIVHPWTGGKVVVNDIKVHSIDMNVSPSTVTKGDIAVISGQLIASAPIAGSTIFVKYETSTGYDGSEWVSEGGSFSMYMNYPVGIHTFTFSYEGDSGTVYSNPITLTVKSSELQKPNISLNSVTPSVSIDDGKITISGKLTTDQGAPIYGKTIWVKADSNGRGQGASAITDSAGNFSAELNFWTDNDIATWTVYAYFERDEEYSDTESNTQQFSVTAAAPVKQDTNIYLDPIPPSVPLGQTQIIEISGLLLTSDGAVSGKQVWIHTELDDNNSKLTVSTTDSKGYFKTSMPFYGEDEVGTWTISVAFAGDDEYYSSESERLTFSIIASTPIPTPPPTTPEQHVGLVWWDKDVYYIGDTGVFTVKDPDLNVNSNSADYASITLFSDSDTKNVEIQIRETGDSTGIFAGYIIFGSITTNAQLKVSENDKVTVEYSDTTLPSPYSPTDLVSVTDSATINVSGSPPSIQFITVWADRASYVEGDTITIGGSVGVPLSDIPVTVNVYSPNNDLISLMQLYVGADGSFETQLVSGGPLWELSGVHTVKVQYGSESRTGETTFQYEESNDTPQIEAIQILGYDARAVTNLQMHDGHNMVATSGNLDQMLKIGERVAIYIKNHSVQKIVLGEIWLGGFQYTYKNVFVAGLGNWDTVFAGELLTTEYTVLTGTNGGDQLLNERAGEIKAGQTVTIILDLESDLRIGRSSQFKLVTTNGNVFVGTVSVGQQSGGENVPDPPTPPPPTPAGVDVEIALGSSVPGCETTNSCFIPYSLSVDVGANVAWYNADTAAHTITSTTPSYGETGSFDSGLIMSGKSYVLQFPFEGTFSYFDMVHPWMTGEIVVGSTLISESSVGTFTINDNEFEISSYKTAKVTVSGTIYDPLRGIPLKIELQIPDGTTEEFKWLITSGGNIDGIIYLDNNYPTGTYQLSANYNNEELPPISFTLRDEKEVPVQISSITLTTDKSTYDHNSSIIVMGDVTSPDSNFDVGLVVMNSNDNIVAIDQIPVASDGSYKTTLSTSGEPWKYDGTYTIKVTYKAQDVYARADIELTGAVSSSITVSTDKKSYEKNDTIIVSGHVGEILEDFQVTLMLLESTVGTQLAIQQFDVNPDGTFSTEITTSGSLWESDGFYSILVMYGSESNSAETQFTFTFTKLPTEQAISVLTLDSLPSTVLRGETVLLSGRLTTQSGNPLADREIILIDGNNNEALWSTITQSTGEFNTKWTVGNTYDVYRWSVAFNGDNEYDPATSETYTVNAQGASKSILYLDPLANTVLEGDDLIFRGQLIRSDGTPLVGKNVSIKDDVTLGTDTIVGSVVTDENGEFSFVGKSIQSRQRGAYDFYAFFEGDSTTNSARSATYSVYVTVSQVVESVRVSTNKSVYSEGDVLLVSGTATPHEELEIALVYLNKEIIVQETVQVDSLGTFSTVLFTWKTSPDVPFSEYSVVAWSPIDKRYDVLDVIFIQSEPTTYQTKISLNKPPSTVILDEMVTFSGILQSIDGKPLGFMPVGIATMTNQNPELLGQGITDADGKFSLIWTASYTSSSSTLPVFSFFRGNQIYDQAISDPHNITIEKPSLSVFTDKTTYKTGESLIVYGYGYPGDKITISSKSPKGNIISSKETIVSSDGSYGVVMGTLSTTLTEGTYTITATSSSFGASDSVRINIEAEEVVLPKSIDIVGDVFYTGDWWSKVPIEGIKVVLNNGPYQKTEFADNSGHFEFKDIKFDRKGDYSIHVEMTDGKSFNFVDGNKYNPDKYENPSAEGGIITSYAIPLPIDRTKSINNFSIDLVKFLPYENNDSYIITKGFDTQTKIVDFYNKVLGERPPLINIFIFGGDGKTWYWSTVWDPQTGKVDSQYQPRIHIQRTTGFDAFGMEYTHYVQDYAYYKMKGYDTNPRGKDGCNHCGFNNESTADSWVEGVGSFLPAVIKYRENLPGSGKFEYIDLELNIYAPDSDKIGKYNSDGKLIWLDEEYSIATLLWDMYDNRNDGENISMSIGQVWDLIKGFDYYQRHNPSYDSEDRRHVKYFKDFYDYLVENSSIPKNDIDDLFALHSIPNGWAAGKHGRP